MDILFTKNGYVNFESLTSVLISSTIWRFVYMISRRTFPKKSCEYGSRLTAFVHGLLVSFLGINECFHIDLPFYHPEWRTSYVQSFILVTSVGYFVHDLIWCMQYDRNDKLIIAHHIYSVVFLMRSLFKGVSGGQTTCGLGAMEVTNPLLQTRWLIHDHGLDPSPLFTCVEYMFLCIFFLVRIVLGTFVTGIVVNHPKNDLEFIISTLVLYVISWIFFVNIIKYVICKYSTGKVRGDIKQIE